MPCYHPLKGYISEKVNKTGKRSLVFCSDKSLLPVVTTIACGRCIGCRLDRSLQWATRCVHEAQMHDDNCFITLTFNNDNLDSSLRVADFQKFMKRLRKFISPRKVRFFHCGEYGVKFSRPHHHACLFGYDFPDKILFKEFNGNKIYTSEILQNLWPFGFSTIGDVTLESAAYVARYVMKKWSKENLEGSELYEAMSALSDEDKKKMYYGEKHEEYITMSRRPGIGQSWYDNFKRDIFPSGFVVINGRKLKIPKYYDSRFELDNVFMYGSIKGERIKRASENPNNSRSRLDVKEQLKLQTIKQLKRGFEYDS